MFPLSIKFQAFIPKSLGKPLLSYFENTNRFRLLDNKEEFIRQLSSFNIQRHTWLPEPDSLSNYYATDNVEIFHHHSEHTTRLAINAEIDLTKIGNYNFESEIFRHDKHNFKYGGANSQHSGKSHQVKAYIKRIPFHDDTPRASNKDMYIGVCSELHSDRSDEAPLDISINNSKKHSFSDGGDDTTTIKISASAGYPFAEPFSPNIDFELEIKLFKNLSSKSIDVQVKGWHNDFPAYELIIDDRAVYTHNPSDYGYTGPGFGNLTKSRDFQRTHTIYLNDWDIRTLKEKNKFGR
ncbi:hypothetical protein [Tenacibaculum finnmarkense]|uniref:hypothetical protein n=1 Tax=Tenacibaculum finnmarkense TaxID=2781243 RepID=UPI000C5CED4E|nr:hypothetical protein [Tenacibaculum finnmarkense]MCD8440864.1 hypothetical protein [Tenacibaculum finnmarkense genomovar ulcerans]MCG8721810.1 hypothetical protein [Tenacibaculum finnmarkense]SOS56062.1 hypothetical protein TFHFJT_580004 [Tenacibaculum finnmarkense]